MKKILIGFLAVAVLFSGFSTVVLAQSSDDTSVADLQAQISQLLNLINSLQQQIATLNQIQGEIRETRSEIKETLRLTRNLAEGMSGDDVRALQEALASDPELYPEGLVTGFFGPLTSRAVRNFQRKFGIEQVGAVGPKTRGQFNIIFLAAGVEEVDEDRQDGRKAFIPPGLLKKSDVLLKAKKITENATSSSATVDKLVAICHVPPGNRGKAHTLRVAEPAVRAHAGHGDYLGECGDNGDNGDNEDEDDDDIDEDEENDDDTLDTSAPIISGVMATSTMATSTGIIWNTNEVSDSTVWYSTTTPIVVSVSTTEQVNNASLVSEHIFTLNDLATSTIYYYMVGSTDVAGNSARSGEFSFTTLQGQ
jgi:peptidoglycan hydrolase-like protein with peptidoglycan-binding domain